ncbi:MAG: response regulator transcription factor [Blastocatellia bacterium]
MKSRITHYTYHALHATRFPMSILIAEDMAFQREYLRAIIADNFADSGPVIETADGNTAVELALKERPSLVVLDIKLPGLSGVKAARQIWSELNLARIIFWSQYKDEIYIRELSRFVPGETVYGYVLKSSPDERLIAALRAVLQDEQCWIDPEIRTVQSRATNRSSGLTDIEYEALIDIALGLTDKAIARRRYLSERGVQNRLRELYAKLSIDIEQIIDERWGSTYSPRSRAISIALQRGLINADELAGENESLQAWLQRENAMPG